MGRSLVVIFLLASIGWITLINWNWVYSDYDTSPLVSVRTIQSPVLDNMTDNATNLTISKIVTDNAQTYSRPLFNRKRRKFVKPKPVKHVIIKPEIIIEEETELPPKPIEPLNAKLIGVFGDESNLKALLITKDARIGSWLKAGDKIDGWLIKKVGSEKIILTSGDETTELNLYEQKKKANVEK